MQPLATPLHCTCLRTGLRAGRATRRTMRWPDTMTYIMPACNTAVPLPSTSRTRNTSKNHVAMGPLHAIGGLPRRADAGPHTAFARRLATRRRHPPHVGTTGAQCPLAPHRLGANASAQTAGRTGMDAARPWCQPTGRRRVAQIRGDTPAGAPWAGVHGGRACHALAGTPARHTHHPWREPHTLAPATTPKLGPALTAPRLTA